MANKPTSFPDVYDPYEEAPSKRYAKYNACEGLKFKVLEDERVLQIILDRPTKVNAITQAMYNTLHCMFRTGSCIRRAPDPNQSFWTSSLWIVKSGSLFFPQTGPTLAQDSTLSGFHLPEDFVWRGWLIVL